MGTETFRERKKIRTKEKIHGNFTMNIYLYFIIKLNKIIGTLIIYYFGFNFI